MRFFTRFISEEFYFKKVYLSNLNQVIRLKWLMNSIKGQIVQKSLRTILGQTLLTSRSNFVLPGALPLETGGFTPKIYF